MQFKKYKVEELRPADYNPRKELKPGDPEFEKLKRSIQEVAIHTPYGTTWSFHPLPDI